PWGVVGDVTDRRIDTRGRTVGRQAPWEIADLLGGCIVGQRERQWKQRGEGPRRGVVDEAGGDRRASDGDPYLHGYLRRCRCERGRTWRRSCWLYRRSWVRRDWRPGGVQASSCATTVRWRG